MNHNKKKAARSEPPKQNQSGSNVSGQVRRRNPRQTGLLERLSDSRPPLVELPGDGRLLSAFASDCAGILRTCGIYQRGGVAFIINEQRNGLEPITAPMLRTLVERKLCRFRRRRESPTVIS